MGHSDVPLPMQVEYFGLLRKPSTLGGVFADGVFSSTRWGVSLFWPN